MARMVKVQLVCAMLLASASWSLGSGKLRGELSRSLFGTASLPIGRRIWANPAVLLLWEEFVLSNAGRLANVWSISES